MSKIKEQLLKDQEEELEFMLGYEEYLMQQEAHPTSYELDQMEKDSKESKCFNNNAIITDKGDQMKTRTITTADEVLEIDAKTGEILVAGDISEFNKIRMTKIKALKILSHEDFVMINGIWEAKRDGLIKILSSLPISYSWELKDRELNKDYAQVLGVLTVNTGSTTRKADSMGVCEMKELQGQKNLHFMNARAETRALKRAIETLFGSVINYYVAHCLLS